MRQIADLAAAAQTTFVCVALEREPGSCVLQGRTWAQPCIWSRGAGTQRLGSPCGSNPEPLGITLPGLIPPVHSDCSITLQLHLPAFWREGGESFITKGQLLGFPDARQV